MNIGQKVRIKSVNDLPKELQTRAYVGMATFEAEIIDRLYSDADQAYSYKLRLTGSKTVPAVTFPEDALDPVADEPVEYYHEIDYLDNVVVVRFYEARGDKAKELARGHGHVIHTGAIGIAQAASYAMKRAYEQLLKG